jgi:HAMP domain-containing protein
MSNTGTGFWVTIMLIAAMSVVALIETAVGCLLGAARRLGRPLRSRA